MIPADKINHIFERFYRANTATDGGTPPGAGLGLAIVKKIADAHQAEIKVASSPDGLTEFQVEIKKF